MRIGWCLLLSLTAACTSGSTAGSAPPAPTRTAAPTATVSGSESTSSAATATASASPSPVVLAISDQDLQPALYVVPAGGHAAVLVRRLRAPDGYTVAGVSLSTGARPTTCVVFEPVRDGGNELHCYAPGAIRGRLVARNVGYGVGLRADGRALAYEQLDGRFNQTLVIADLSGDRATIRRRLPYAENQRDGVPEGMGDLDWIDDRTLGVTGVADSDEGEGLCVVELARPRQQDGIGFGRCLHPGPSEKGYAHFEQGVVLEPGVVVAVERALSCCNDAVNDPNDPPARAVRLRLADGAVLEAFATPRPGRQVDDVSGGPRAVVYTTSAHRSDVVVSIRYAGESRGAPVTGLPPLLKLAVAQP